MILKSDETAFQEGKKLAFVRNNAIILFHVVIAAHYLATLLMFLMRTVMCLSKCIAKHVEQHTTLNVIKRTRSSAVNK